MRERLFMTKNNCLREIFGVYWPDRISNEELWRRCGLIPVADTIEQRKFR